MKKLNSNFLKISVIALILCAITGIIFLFSAFPESKNLTEDYFPNATFSNLNVNIEVDENGRYNISETFDVQICAEGLTEVIRYIPYHTSVSHIKSNGKVTKKTLYAKIKNAKLTTYGNEKLKIYYDELSGYVTFGIKNVMGYNYGDKHTFTLSYVYDLGDTADATKDEFYYNIVGHTTASNIKNVSFSVKFLNAGIDKNKIACYIGEMGSTQKLTNLTITNNTISGSIDNLDALNGITLQVELPEGYFNYSKHTPIMLIIALIAVIILSGVVIFYVIKHKQKYTPVKPVQVVPPDFANVFNASFYNDGKVSNNAITANIIYLANKGYLEIKEANKNFTLHKIKDISPKEEKYVIETFNALFEKSDTVDLNSENSFYKYSLKAKQVAERVEITEDSVLYSAQSKSNIINKPRMLGIISSLALILSVILSVLFFFGFISQVLIAPIILQGLILAIYCLLVKNRDAKWWYALIFAVPSTLNLMLLYGLGFFIIDSYCLVIFASIIILLTMAVSIQPISMKKQGELNWGQIQGFKHYIKMAELDRIKVLAEQNPYYFYEVLPYAYVFNLTDVWIEKFKTLQIIKPIWYLSEAIMQFDYNALNSLLNTSNLYTKKSIAIYNAQKAEKSTLGGNSSGGGFSGGGFSGGGAGGGGFGAR